ncbi:unnamed protein product [Leptidea sinapis]|uniref:Ig-like domain-containing protein n=1 Tax=Leptidea sinapis TaxID=189913 RepID=A0A5E4QV71_9NEOP|nr:unnamed protein product [Leptidea sinapis]
MCQINTSTMKKQIGCVDVLVAREGTDVSRTQMGAYLCIASNDVPPSVSKRIMLSVNFAPSISIPSKVIGVPTGSQAKLECLVESYPRAISYWLKSGEEMILSG